MSEFNKLVNTHNNIAFNDVPSKRNKDHSLFIIEPIVVLPNQYELNILRQYKMIYTWNSKFREILANCGIESILVNGFPLFGNYANPFKLFEASSFDDKKDLSLICRYRTNMIHESDITNLRYSTFDAIDLEEKECFGKVPYLGTYYKGVIGNTESGTCPSSNEKIMKMNEYKFNLCFENCYHEIHSFDYITEKITDCFKAKTIPIYYGCFNIGDKIPKDLFIDFRKFKEDIPKLNKYLKGITKTQFEDMTEKAFEFVNNEFNWYGNIKILEEIFKENENDSN